MKTSEIMILVIIVLSNMSVIFSQLEIKSDTPCLSITEMHFQISSKIEISFFQENNLEYSMITFGNILLSTPMFSTSNKIKVEYGYEAPLTESFLLTAEDKESEITIPYYLSKELNYKQRVPNCFLNLIFYSCYETCSTCKSHGDILNNKCDSCIEGFYPIEGHPSQCVNVLPQYQNEFFFFDRTEKIFLQCSEEKGNIFKCANCLKDNKYYLNGKCIDLDNKPMNTFISDNIYGELQYCYDYCSQCDKGGNLLQHNCNVCIEGYFLLYEKGGNCVKLCPDYMGVNSEGTMCINCKNEGKYAYNGNCIDDIPLNGYIEDEKFNYVQLCYETCEKCERGGNKKYHNCLTCKEGYEFDVTIKGNCNIHCEGEGYGIEYNSSKCIKCKDEGKYLDTKEHKCIDNIKEGYYVDSEGRLNECFDTCATCVIKGDEENHKCLSCLYNNKIDDNGNCKLDYCPEYLNSNKEINRCVNCKEKGLFLYNGECVEKDQLPIQSYIEDERYNYVKECYSKCVQCKERGSLDKNNCDVCKGDYLTIDGNCVLQCPKYSVLKGNKCVMCKDEGEFYYNGNCVEKCPNNTKANTINNICLDAIEKRQCAFKCYNEGICDISTYSNCKCKDGYTGIFCEIEENVNNSMIKISSINTVIRLNDIIAFKISLISSLDIDNYSIKWVIEGLNPYDTLTGLDNAIIKIKPYKLKENKNNKIEVILTNKATSQTISSWIKVYISFPIESSYSSLLSYKGNLIYPYKTKVLLITTNSNEEDTTNCYKYLYENSFLNKIPLSNDCDYIGVYYDTIPPLNALIIQIINPQGIIIEKKISIDNIINEQSQSYNTNIYKLVNIGELSNYSQFGFISVINEIDRFISNRENSLSQSEYNLIKDIILYILNSRYIDHLLSIQLINTLISTGNIDNDDIIKFVIYSIENMNEEPILKSEKILPYYNTIQNIMDKNIDNGISLIKEINKKVTLSLSPGEQMQIKSNSFINTIIKPSISQSHIFLQYPKISNVSSFDIFNSFGNISETCDLSNYMFCIEQNDYNRIVNQLHILNKIDINKLTFNIISIKNIPLLSTSTIRTLEDSNDMSYYSSISLITYLNKEEEDKNVNELPSVSSLKYSISLPNDLSSLNESSQSERVCVTIDSIFSYSSYCYTFFNYETKRTICKCVGKGKISGVISKTLSNFYKLLQFPPLSLSKLNIFTLTFCITTIMIFLISTISLNCIDYKDDGIKIDSIYKKGTKMNKLHKAFGNYVALSSFNTIIFSLYATSYIYPFFGIFYIYDCELPRYVRFFIEMFSLILSIMFSILPYYFSPFTYKEMVINERDIKKMSWSIHNLPSRLCDLLYSLIYSVISNVITIVLVFIFSKLVKYNELLSAVWRKKKKDMRLYTKKYIALDYCIRKGQWKIIVNRLKVIYNVNKLYKDIVIRKYSIHIDDEYQKEKMMELMERNGCEMEIYEISYRGQHKTNINKKKEAKKIKENEFIIVQKGVHCFEINSNGIKYEDISNRERNYNNIMQSNSSMKVNMQLVNRSIFEEAIEPILYNRDIKIEHLPNYTFINIIRNKFDNIRLCNEFVNKIKTLTATFGIIVMLSFVYYFIFVVFTDVYEKYEFYIIKIWLYPVLISIIVGRIVSNFSLNLVKILIIEKFYKQRKKNFILRLIFNFFIPDYLINMIKVKCMVKKYNRFYIE